MSGPDEEADDDAIIEPAPPSEDPVREAAMEAMPQVIVHRARSRERMRNVISLSVLGATGATAAVAVVGLMAGADHVGSVTSGVLTPLIGLSGTVVGFYFGGKDSTA